MPPNENPFGAKSIGKSVITIQIYFRLTRFRKEFFPCVRYQANLVREIVVRIFTSRIKSTQSGRDVRFYLLINEKHDLT